MASRSRAGKGILVERRTWVMPMTIVSPRSSRGTGPAANAAAVRRGTGALFRAGRHQKSLEFGLLILAIALAAGVIWGVFRPVSAPIEQSGLAGPPTRAWPGFRGARALVPATAQHVRVGASGCGV